MRRFDVCIIGGGAAGLVAAASLDKSLKVCIFEKNEIPGRKLMATGGGRCNITNNACRHKKATLDFFASLGLETYCDGEGRYFPYSNKAGDVTQILVNAQDKNVKANYGHKVTDIAESDKGFIVTAEAGEKTVTVRADNVLLATGGKAAPQYGTTGDGYRFAKALGMPVTRVYPILAPIECEENEIIDFRKAKGVRARGTVRLMKDGAPVAEAGRERGEIQFTEDGISGICVFNLTRYIVAEEGENVEDAMARYKLSVDLAPDFYEGALSSRKSTFGILTGGLAESIDGYMARSGHGAEIIKDIRLDVRKVKGWRNAQCTAGGVVTDVIDMRTMESLLVPGLYLAGELLDVQGPCGGFNLQNAWETGYKAARAINRKYAKKQK